LEFVLSRIQRVPRVADFFHLEDCLKISSERLAFPAGRVAAPDGMNFRARSLAIMPTQLKSSSQRFALRPFAL
jgi:hypothetical protein